ncbi:MAG: hypothetical protein P8080_02535 [Gammaproteobacteria bacterium]
MTSLWTELRRRNVVRVGIAYAVVAWLLVQIGEAVFPAFDVPDSIFRGLVILLLLGLPAVLVFAWVFEMTPEGIKREKDVDRSASITPDTGRKLDRLIIVTLALAVVVLLVDRFLPRAADDAVVDQESAAESPPASRQEPDQAAPAGEPSVAVLPFVNMSDDPANEYFSDGISEELLNFLVKVDGIKVASRTSSFAFKDKDVSIPEIADQLHVDHVLEGSVRKAGNRVRVTAQLIDVETDRHLWSETYDRELEDIFAIQEEISSHIVEALQVALGAGEAKALADAGKPTDNLEAYELYLKGRYFWQRRGEDNIRQSIDLLKKAIALDPAFARAWSALAAAYITLPTYSSEPWTWPEWFDEARDAAERALALDDTQADAYAVLGDITRGANEWARAEDYYLAAIENEPKNVTGHLWYAEFLFCVGRLEDARRHNEIALELDPLSPGANINLAGNYMALGRADDGVPLARMGAKLGHLWGHGLIGLMHLRRGEYAEAATEFRTVSEKLDGQPVVFEPVAAALASGEREQAVQALLALPAEQAWPAGVVHGLVFLGAVDEAYQDLDAHFDEIGGNDWFMLWGPEMAPFRQDPRFVDVMGRLGLLEYWRNSTWPDLCQPEGDGIACR